MLYSMLIMYFYKDYDLKPIQKPSNSVIAFISSK